MSSLKKTELGGKLLESEKEKENGKEQGYNVQEVKDRGLAGEIADELGKLFAGEGLGGSKFKGTRDTLLQGGATKKQDRIDEAIIDDNRELLLEELISSQKDLLKLVDEEEALSSKGHFDLLKDKSAYRTELIERIDFSALNLIDFGISFGARKINPKKIHRL